MSICCTSVMAVLCIFLTLLSDFSSQTNLLSNSMLKLNHEAPSDQLPLQVTGVYGMTATLPCFTNTSNSISVDLLDRANLVLWFRDQELSPFYTYDNVQANNPPNHWRDPDLLSAARYNFLMSSSGMSSLQIERLGREDGGLYRCRVDFEHHATVIWWIELTVIVPPDKPRIVSMSGRNAKIKHGELEIFGENKNVTLKCRVSGGDPVPAVTWWKNNILLDTSYERFGENIVNELTLSQVRRTEQNTRLVCSATNTNLTQSVNSVLQLNIRVLPKSVAISGSGPGGDMVEGQGATFECVVTGGNPRPLVFWLLNDKKYTTVEYTESEGETMMSAIFLTPDKSHHGAQLACRAEVENVTGYMQDSTVLNVKYGPSVSIKLGDPLQLDDIEEGHDVYFTCQVDSNPQPKLINWMYNGHLLHLMDNSRLLASENILAIQGVQTEDNGDYSCSANNFLGQDKSPNIHLDVKYRPKCALELKTEYSAFKFQTISMVCVVRANPSKMLQFHWSFNGTVPKYVQKNQGNQSVVEWMPDLSQSLTIVTCSATNSVGTQVSPCVFSVMSQYPPQPPDNCILTNITHAQFTVMCSNSSTLISSSSSSSGSSTYFYLTVTVSNSGEQVFSSHSQTSSFLVSDLVPSTSYTLKLWAQNSLGTSEPNYISTTTLNVPDTAERKYKNDTNTSTSGMWLYVFLGLTVTVTALLLSLLTLSLHQRRSQRRHNQDDRVAVTRADTDREPYNMYLKVEPGTKNSEVDGSLGLPLCPEFKKDCEMSNDSSPGPCLSEENMLVYNCADVTIQTMKYANIASNRNKPVRESFI